MLATDGDQGTKMPSDRTEEKAAVADPSRRIAREKKTVAAMIRLYCRRHHGRLRHRRLCKECDELHEYAMARLDRCPLAAEKPPCSKCPIHCYRPAMRDRIREVMRYAGPRMLIRHPILAIGHLLDSLRTPTGD